MLILSRSEIFERRSRKASRPDNRIINGLLVISWTEKHHRHLLLCYLDREALEHGTSGSFVGNNSNEPNTILHLTTSMKSRVNSIDSI